MDYQNYAMGKWVSGDGDGTPLFNAITGIEIGSANSCLLYTSAAADE